MFHHRSFVLVMVALCLGPVASSRGSLILLDQRRRVSAIYSISNLNGQISDFIFRDNLEAGEWTDSVTLIGPNIFGGIASQSSSITTTSFSATMQVTYTTLPSFVGKNISQFARVISSVAVTFEITEETTFAFSGQFERNGVHVPDLADADYSLILYDKIAQVFLLSWQDLTVVNGQFNESITLPAGTYEFFTWWSMHTDIVSDGSASLSYEFAVVPAPATVMPFLCMVLARRSRRPRENIRRSA